MNKRILQLAVPSIISNITVPLLGLVDVAIVGHIGDAAYIGAIAVGGDAVQCHLLAFRIPENGNQRNDFAGFGKERFG